jgi:GT2 family glycosyltransferase
MVMEKEIKLVVVIPTINRADLLNEALAKYFEDFKNTHIAICDNGKQDIITREENFMIYRPEQNLNVSGSWNMLMDYSEKIGATHVLILNDDVYLGRNEHEIKLLIKQNIEIPFMNSLMNWCSFILSVEGYKKIGEFNQEYFPNYYNDNDYCYRMRLLNIERLNTSFLNPVVYRNSMTIAKDPSLNNRFMEYRQNYINMWGGLPNEEKFTTKFNK